MYTLIKNGTLVNEGKIYKSDVLINGDRIETISQNLKPEHHFQIIDASGFLLIPGMIDTHVHFREPGLSYKGTIETESKAAIAGGVTSFMEMPNTIPNTTSIQLLEDKYALASQSSYANYSFYFGLNSQNLDEALTIDNSRVCGITDDGLYFDQKDSMLCNNYEFLEKLFAKSKSLIALHCENEKLIEENETHYKKLHGASIWPEMHAEIRSEAACYTATENVVQLAKQYNARVHILHLSTAKETMLFDDTKHVSDKRITAEACVHHLYFNSDSYHSKGMLIKWNPSIKYEHDRKGLLNAIKTKRIDNIATDHAPHSLSEKLTDYFSSKSGAPSVQHALQALLTLYHRGEISLEEIVQATSHNPAEMFRIIDRGYIREGYYADLVLLNPDTTELITQDQLLYKCGWSPFKNEVLRGNIKTVLVNGTVVFDSGIFTGHKNSRRLMFNPQR